MRRKKDESDYFYGTLPIFHHDEDDTESFRFITSRLVVSGNVKQIEIVNAFDVPYISVKRGVKRLREEGSKGFKKRKGRSPHVLVPDVIKKVQLLLTKGYSTSEVIKQLDMKTNTLNKAIRERQLHKKKSLMRGMIVTKRNHYLRARASVLSWTLTARLDLDAVVKLRDFRQVAVN